MACLRLAVSAIVLALIASPTKASPIILEETARIESPDSQAPFTGPISIHANTMVVASVTRRDSDGNYNVSIFVYERSTASSTWRFARKLTQFVVGYGYDSSMLRLDATQNAIAIVAVGYSAVFERVGTDWIEKKLLPPETGDFPSDVAISGQTVIAGGKTGTINGYVYEKSADGSWPLSTVLQADAIPYGDNDYFGEMLDVDGDYAALVSPDSIFDWPLVGHLYVFRRAAGQWRQYATLNDPTTPSSPSTFADASVLSLTSSMGVAAFRNDEGGYSIFTEATPADWSAIEKVRPLDAMYADKTSTWPRQVYVDGQLARSSNRANIALGAFNDEDRGAASGSVSVFRPRVAVGHWEHQFKLLASDSRPGLGLGSSIGFYGSTVAAIGGSAVYVFQLPEQVEQRSRLQDDFEGGSAADWRQSSGDWSVTSSLGSRVYRQSSTSGEHVTRLSGIDWNDIAIEADVRPRSFSGSDRWVSLMTRVVDEQNYYYVALRNTNVLRLARRVGNTFTTLATTSLPVVANRTYRVRIEAVGTWIRAYVNGELKLEARDATHRHGSVAMKTSFASAQFDNVLVSPTPQLTLLESDFTRTWYEDTAWQLEPAANWTPVDLGAGNWVMRQTSASGTSRAIAGVRYEVDDPQLADHVIEARVLARQFSSKDALVGLMARFKDNSNYVSAVVTGGGILRLRQNSNGTTRILDSVAVPIATNTWYRIRLEAVGDRLRVYLNNALHLEARDATVDSANTRGRYGLITVGTAADFDDVKVREP